MLIKEMAWDMYILGSVQILVIVCGILGNVLVIYSIMKEKRLLKSSYYFLVLNLAVFDALHLLSFIRLNYTSFSRRWLFTEAIACKIWVYFEMLFCTSAIQLMVVICVFRYRAVLTPLKPPILQKKIKFISAFLVVITSIYLIPYIVAYVYNPSKGCYPEWSSRLFGTLYTSLSLNVHYIVPVTTMTILYYKICKALISQTKKLTYVLRNKNDSTNLVSQSLDPQEHFNKVRHHRNTKTFLVSAVCVGIFTVALLPFEVWWICHLNGVEIVKPGHEGWFYSIYMIGSSSVNPFIYGMLDKKLVEGFKRSMKRFKYNSSLFNSRGLSD